MGDYNIESIYGGGYSSMDSDKAGYFTGYRIPAAKLGMATDPRTANILTDVSEKLKSGAKQIEVSAIQPNVFESVPNQQLKEINRLAKLTGVDISVHGILTDPSGIGQQGYNELAREESERQMLSNVLRAHEMSPDGNMPVTFHSSLGWNGAEYRPVEENGKTNMEKWRIPIVNQTTGQINLAEADTQRIVGMDEEKLAKGDKVTALDHVRMRNNTEWDNSLTTLIAIKERADRAIHETEPIAQQIVNKIHEGTKFESLTPTEKDIILRYQSAGQELHDIRKHLNNVFDNAYKFGPMTPEQKNSYQQELVKISETFGKSLEEDKYLSEQSRSMGVLMKDLMKLEAPQVYKPLEDFAVDKSAETFGNVAFKAYSEFKDKAPIISIENPPAGGGLSRAEDLTKVINAARDKFIENAMKPKDRGGLAMSQSDARKQAEKLIGATWDVGHINMIRKYGFSEEDTLNEAKKIAPLVKHVHLSDNFGFEHTELPMGMGNVPIEKIMKRLGEKGFEARKVIEAGDWWQHFKTPPFQESLEAFGSPIYGMKMAPYWNQSVGVQGYFSGYGNMLPQINYETMGAGFSMLPPELGGSRQGGNGSRMSGRGME
jgi:sugar phosphate isomerase/epimerase